MIKHTEWRPHTCGCVIIYSWDTEVPADKRTHTIVDQVMGHGVVHKTTHCGGNHIPPPIGAQLEGSAFHEEYKRHEAARVAQLPSEV
jgi:hypothetical protein